MNLNQKLRGIRRFYYIKFRMNRVFLAVKIYMQMLNLTTFKMC